ncbi:virulence RhuM family protein [Candidatus Gracilibacteria bacterium]|nr:virulence RhuM family protein [Candidatus Gracilibacteria bacterium]
MTKAENSLKTGEILLYKDKDGRTEIEVKFENETVWLNQKQMAMLFDRDSDTIGNHIQNVFEEKELDPEATTGNFPVVQKEGNRTVKRNLIFYNLDVIISVGYRVKSLRGTQFRIRATQRLKDYLVKGGGKYFKKLTYTCKLPKYLYNEIREKYIKT